MRYFASKSDKSNKLCWEAQVNDQTKIINLCNLHFTTQAINTLFKIPYQHQQLLHNIFYSNLWCIILKLCKFCYNWMVLLSQAVCGLYLTLASSRGLYTPWTNTVLGLRPRYPYPQTSIWFCLRPRLLIALWASTISACEFRIYSTFNIY